MGLPLTDARKMGLIRFWTAHALTSLENMLEESENEYYHGEAAKIALRNALCSLKLLHERGK